MYQVRNMMCLIYLLHFGIDSGFENFVSTNATSRSNRLFSPNGSDYEL